MKKTPSYLDLTASSLVNLDFALKDMTNMVVKQATPRQNLTYKKGILHLAKIVNQYNRDES